MFKTVKYLNRIQSIIFAALLGFPRLSAAADEPVAPLPAIVFQVHSGYFVSNQFEADSPTSFVVCKDQAAFDKVFGEARVMRDKSLRLLPEAFSQHVVVSAIHRGKSFVSYRVERLAVEGKVLKIYYSTKSEPSSSAEFACPLIVSVPKGDYESAQFIEDGKEIKKVGVGLSMRFEITAREAGTLTMTEEGGKTIFSIKGGRGIGEASVRRLPDGWPPEIVVRAYLRGLELFSVSDGLVKLSASVLSHSGNKQLLHLWKGGKEGPPLDAKSPYQMKIRVCNADGKPVQGLPPEGGWFEMTLPRALLKKANTIELGWINFYR